MSTGTKTSYAGGYLVAAGVVIGIVGAVVMVVAASRKRTAAGIAEFASAMHGGTPAEVQAAVTLGHIGLAVLVVGVLVALAGAVVALRR